jgi:adenine-specific DNA-methyltransferase
MDHEFARKLRRDQTDVERKLWYALRDRRFHDFNFRRQQPIGPYVVDFICFRKNLVIELDGSQHGEDDARRKDERRTAYLNGRGYRVIRFWNHEINQNLDGVFDTIERELTRPLTRVSRD